MENNNQQLCFLKRRNLAAKSILLGCLSGLVAVLFRIGLEKAEQIRVLILEMMRAYHAMVPSAIFAMSMAAILIVLKRWAPEASKQ